MENKAPRTRKYIIHDANKNSLFTTIPLAETVEAKRELVLLENPNHYVFGEIRRAWKPWLSYEENMAEEYVG